MAKCDICDKGVHACMYKMLKVRFSRKSLIMMK